MAISISPKDIGPEISKREENTPKMILKAMNRSAMRGQSVLTRRTPKDLGQAKAGWRVSRPISTSRGGSVDLFNDAPYVGIIEMGARPHGVNKEGRIAIYEWVLRNIQISSTGKSRKPRADQAMQIMQAIVAKLRRVGQRPKYFVKRSMPELNKDLAGNISKSIVKFSSERQTR